MKSLSYIAIVILLGSPLPSYAQECWAASNIKGYSAFAYDGYAFSKQCLIVYTLSRAGELARREQRINCISPSPTATAFTVPVALARTATGSASRPGTVW